jgi:hypothetical protein
VSLTKSSKAVTIPANKENPKMTNVISLDEYRKKKNRKTFMRVRPGANDENNERVLEKLKEGDNLSTSTLEDSWFPVKGVFDREKGRMVPSKVRVTDDDKE